MRTEVYQAGDGEWVTHVYLSRRNLLSLLAKLDEGPGASTGTLWGPPFYPVTGVTAEEDVVHYAHESRGESVGVAGRMSPATEAQILNTDKRIGDPEYGLEVR